MGDVNASLTPPLRWTPSLFIAPHNDLRVFASRSRCKNSVGLNAVGAESSAEAYGIFRRGWVLEARAENKSSPPDGGVVAIAAFEMVGARPTALIARLWTVRLTAQGRVRSCGMPDACKDDLVFVAGERGLARHGPWARF